MTTTSGRAYLRDWARANGIEIADKGAIPARVKDAYIDQASDKAPVIAVGPRSVTVVCPLCTETHTHGIGDGHRVAHCASSSRRRSDSASGYYVVGTPAESASD